MDGGPRLHPREGGPKVPVAYYPRRCAALRVDTQLNAGGEDQKREGREGAARLNADRGEKLVGDISLIDPLFL